MGQNRTLTKGVLVAKGNIDEAVVGESRHSSNGSGLLATTLGASRDEEAGVLAPIGTSGPLLASLVPEGLELGREVSVTSGDAEQEGIILLELRGVGHRLDISGLGGSVHLGEDFIGEGLSDSEALLDDRGPMVSQAKCVLEEGGTAAGLLNALLLSFGL